MKRITQKQFDKMLVQSFLEEAEQIEVPSSEKLWIDLQQRLDKAEMQNIEERLAQLQQAPQKKKQGFQKIYKFFWNKHKYWTGLAAACLVMFIISLQFIPSTGMKNFVQGFFSFMSTDMMSTEIGAGDQGLSVNELEDEAILLEDEAILVEEEGEQNKLPADSERAALPPHTGKSDAPEESAPEESAGVESFSLSIDDDNYDYNSSAQEEIRGHDWETEDELTQERILLEETPEEETSQEEILYKRESFILELNKNKQLSPEKIWQLTTVPEGYTFCEAVITKTDNLLLKVSQKYAKEDNESLPLTLTQEFYQNKVPGDKDLTTADSLAHPIRIGLYNGYFICEKNGFNTIKWKQENSIVTLTGQLEEKDLFMIIDALKEL